MLYWLNEYMYHLRLCHFGYGPPISDLCVLWSTLNFMSFIFSCTSSLTERWVSSGAKFSFRFLLEEILKGTEPQEHCYREESVYR